VRKIVTTVTRKNKKYVEVIINMRYVETVKEKRDELKAEMERFLALKDKQFSHLPYRELSTESKKKFGYIMGTISVLKTQINALEYVLNEDTELEDRTKPSMAYNFTKEELFAELEEPECKCPCHRCAI
jgi:hypothetical protein